MSIDLNKKSLFLYLVGEIKIQSFYKIRVFTTSCPGLPSGAQTSEKEFSGF
jgi:hypothetical protein